MGEDSIYLRDDTQVNTELNSSLTVVNLLDELDWVIGGYGKPTAQFMYSLNTFVESYVLNDYIYLPVADIMHIRYTQPFYPNGRPILETMADSRVLKGTEEGLSPVDSKDVGRVISVFFTAGSKKLESGEKPAPPNYEEWYDAYSRNVDRKYVSELLPSFPIGKIPRTIPLLLHYSKDDMATHAILIFQRKVERTLNSILSSSLASRFHPALPLYAVKPQIKLYGYLPASVDLYRRLADIHHVKLEDILKHLGYSELPVPPLTSILLSRCRDRDDLPVQLKKLRYEFESLREAGRLHEQRLEKASTLREQFEAIEEFNEFWCIFSNKLNRKSARIIYRLWDIFKEPDPTKWFTKSIDLLVEFAREQFILNRYKGLLDIWNLAKETKAAQNQLTDIERIFGSPIDQTEWNAYVKFALKIEKKVFPLGRRFG